MVDTLPLAAMAEKPTSTLVWILQVSSSPGELLALFSAFMIFIGACYLVATRRPTQVLASYLILLPLPFAISLSHILRGMISSYAVISITDTHVTEAEWAGGYASCLMSLLLILIATAPTYLVLAFGLIMSTLRSTNDPLVSKPSRVSASQQSGQLKVGEMPLQTSH